MNNINLGVIVDIPKEHFFFWKDGLRAALDVLAFDYHWNIYIYNIQDSPKIAVDKDFYLFWGALGAKQHQIRNFTHQGLIFGGGPTYHQNLHNFDIVFAESKVDYLDFKRYGIKTVQAFGTNLNVFKPMDKIKIFDYLYPAAFAKWKHHEKFVDFVKRCDIDDALLENGAKVKWCFRHNCEVPDGICPKTHEPVALAVGYMQPGGWEKECYEICEKNDIAVLPWVPAEALAHLYNSSRNVVITADETGGCQRTVLEAKACGTNVIIESDSKKLKELNKLTRDDVVEKWSHISYAKKLAEGIESILCEKSHH